MSAFLTLDSVSAQTPERQPIFHDLTLSHVASGVWPGDEWGRDGRSCKPAAPSARNRATHLATVFGVVWNARAAAAFDEPPSITLRAIASRPLGVSEAFLCVSIRFSANH